MDKIAVGAAGAHQLTLLVIAEVQIPNAEDRHYFQPGILVGSNGIQRIDLERRSRAQRITRRPTATLAVSVRAKYQNVSRTGPLRLDLTICLIWNQEIYNLR